MLALSLMRASAGNPLNKALWQDNVEEMVAESSHWQASRSDIPVSESGGLAPSALTLEAVLSLVAATASEICGAELGAEDAFASHQFDSLSAVELASGISKAVGIAVPSTNPFCSYMHTPPDGLSELAES